MHMPICSGVLWVSPVWDFAWLGHHGPEGMLGWSGALPVPLLPVWPGFKAGPENDQPDGTGQFNCKFSVWIQGSLIPQPMPGQGGRCAGKVGMPDVPREPSEATAPSMYLDVHRAHVGILSHAYPGQPSQGLYNKAGAAGCLFSCPCLHAATSQGAKLMLTQTLLSCSTATVEHSRNMCSALGVTGSASGSRGCRSTCLHGFICG